MNKNQTIHGVINKIPLGKPFSISALTKYASYDNARQILSRMVRSGEIMRATRGIFVRPKKAPYLGKVLPTYLVIAQAIAAKTGEVIATHGAEAARLLQLSTQVPMQTVFYTTGNSRRVKIENHSIILRHISPRKLIKPNTMTGLVISALWYLGRHQVSAETINKVKNQLTVDQFTDVIKQAHRMPIWMRKLFSKYSQGKVE